MNIRSLRLLGISTSKQSFPANMAMEKITFFLGCKLFCLLPKNTSNRTLQSIFLSNLYTNKLIQADMILQIDTLMQWLRVILGSSLSYFQKVRNDLLQKVLKSKKENNTRPSLKERLMQIADSEGFVVDDRFFVPVFYCRKVRKVSFFLSRPKTRSR